MNRSLLTILTILVTLGGAAITAQEPVVRRMGPPPPGKIALATSIVTVPLTTFGTRPQVSVMVNGKGPFVFIFDTGASGSVITDTLLKEAGLPEVGRAMVGSPAGGPPTPAVLSRIDTLEVGGLRIEGLTVTAVDLSHLWKDGPMGILSPSALPGMLTTISLASKQLRIERGALGEADGQSIFEWKSQDRLPVVTVKVGTHEIPAHLDTGAPGALKVPMSWAKQLGLRSPLQSMPSARLMDKEIAQSQADIDTTPMLGRFELSRKVVFQEGTTVGNVGSEALSQFDVTIDITNRRIRLTPVKP